METHRYLNAGEKIQVNDEYYNGSTWHSAPQFLIGDRVPENSAQWRRMSSISVKQPDKKWFSFLFGQKKIV